MCVLKCERARRVVWCVQAPAGHAPVHAGNAAGLWSGRHDLQAAFGTPQTGLGELKAKHRKRGKQPGTVPGLRLPGANYA